MFPAENCFKQVSLQMGEAVFCGYQPENEARTSHLPKLQPTSLAEGMKYSKSTCIFYGAD